MEGSAWCATSYYLFQVFKGVHQGVNGVDELPPKARYQCFPRLEQQYDNNVPFIHNIPRHAHRETFSFLHRLPSPPNLSSAQSPPHPSAPPDSNSP